MIRLSFSQRLKTLRTEHQMTQQMLADRMNVARTTITGYETKNRQPSHEKLTAIADIFGVTIDYLIDEKGTESLSLTSQHENMIDQQVLKLYGQLSLKSKEDVLKYIHLLDSWEKTGKQQLF